MQHSPITADWTQSVAAQRILASFAKHPPMVESIPPISRWDGATVRYAGYRVECLHRLWNEYGEPVLKACDATGDYALFSDFAGGQPTVEAAINTALADPGAGMSARKKAAPATAAPEAAPAVVGKEGIEAGKWYACKGGKLVEVRK